jgi:glyoxylase-like metal-dependent hydrolase (beta-lactamase superfamily II)
LESEDVTAQISPECCDEAGADGWVLTDAGSAIRDMADAHFGGHAGDTAVTTGRELACEIAERTPEIYGLPHYITANWQEAWYSASKLAALEPELIVSGHGRPTQGPGIRAALERLGRDFDRIAFPADMQPGR